MFSTKPYDRRSFAARNVAFKHSLHYREPRLSEETATLAVGFPAVCVFVNDVCDAAVLETLAAGGTRLIALRRLQQCRPRGRERPGSAGGARAGLLAACGGRVHRRHDPHAQPPDPPRL